MKWSPAKFLYIIVRYFCPLFILTEIILPTAKVTVSVCRAAYWFHSWGMIVLRTSVDLVFMLRVSALYGNSKKIVVPLSMGIVAQFVVAAVASLFFAAVESENIIITPTVACLLDPKEWYLALISMLQTASLCFSLTFHTMLFLLTTIRVGMDSIRDHGGLRNLWIIEIPTVVVLIIRDGTLYFGIIFVFTVLETAAVASKCVDHICGGIFTGSYIVALSYSGSHLILRLKRMSDAAEATSIISTSIFFNRPNSDETSPNLSRVEV
ncbi:hypothetical protein BDQ17DRAFT_1380715 [Cyathus striatus]|nr:hypothetical protein BDQ17DRAFT_1380715 [Cyathus striatus]